MGEPARRLATWADLLETPDDGRVWEVLGGSLEAQPRPRPGHGHTQARLLGELSGPFDEIASPCNRRRDRGYKADLYLRVGVPHYWIVDPEERTLEAFEAKAGAWVRLGARSDGDTPRIPPFEAIELDVGGLFAPHP